MEFGTFTDDLNRLKEWLIERECPVVAMERTAPYWTPVHNILEGFFQVILVNARHMRNVPGRKTDLSDSRWLAGLLRHELLKAAFLPAVTHKPRGFKYMFANLEKMANIL